jgi:hypothetical protein
MVGGSGRGELEHLVFVFLLAPIFEQRGERVEAEGAAPNQPFAMRFRN